MMPAATRIMSTGFVLAAMFLALVSADDATAQNWNRKVVVINGTNVVVNSFQASNVNRNTWEEDILGKDVLQPGQRVTVNIDDGTGACLFDFRAILSNGRKVELRRVDVCHVSSWTIR